MFFTYLDLFLSYYLLYKFCYLLPFSKLVMIFLLFPIIYVLEN